MLKETETEKKSFFATFLSLEAFRLGGGAGPPGNAYISQPHRGHGLPQYCKTSNSNPMAVLVVYHVYHTHDLSQRRCAHAFQFITII